jgi:hypothetical protein
MVGRPRFMRIKTTAVVSLSALMLVLAPSAMAQSSSDLAYPQPGGVVQQQVSSGGGGEQPSNPAQAEAAPTAAKSNERGKLPFTGLDVALIVGAGGVLMLLGFGIRRFTRSPEIA